MKNHLKSIFAPKSWPIERRGDKYVAKPRPSGHKMEFGLPLSLLLKDSLGLAATSSEVKKLLHNNEVLVDGLKREEARYMVGLFDVLQLPKLKKSYSMIFDAQGRLSLVEIKNEKASEKTCKILGKTVLAGGKLQYHFHDGRNIISEKKLKIGDSAVISLPQQEIKATLELKPGCWVYLTNGKHRGECGQLKEIKEELAIYTVNGEEVSTLKKYLFVLAEKPGWASSKEKNHEHKENKEKKEKTEDKKSTKKAAGETQ
ncbi:30S ribosomal protein S4e [Candidatus Woesearchaeota archaeon]|nr:30S ribosomal protein S4e [Candidatus Woesearchaeota archaeon]